MSCGWSSTAICQGHARCAALTPGVFELDDDGYVATTSHDLAPEHVEAARRGAAAAPSGS
ncbi:ferredoxin [Janibacter terrae]|uniref:ferredoxin n=1 Tax=Janibacter terrae TaxID=103817 RepID=UPI0009EECF51